MMASVSDCVKPRESLNFLTMGSAPLANAMGLEKAKEYVQELDTLCKMYGFSRLEVSKLFSLNDERIDFFVFGGDSVQQLKEVVEVSKCEDLPESLKRNLRERFADIERDIILPNLWKIKKT